DRQGGFCISRQIYAERWGTSPRPGNRCGRLFVTVLGRRNRFGLFVSDRQSEVADGGLVVDVPPVVAGEGGGVGCQHSRVGVDGTHVIVGVVVPEQCVLMVVRETVGGQIST